MSDLKNKVAVGTGASRGLGQGITLEFARRAATVVRADLREAEATSDEARKYGSHRSKAVDIDVTDWAAVEKLVRSTAGVYGSLDLMPNYKYCFPDRKSHPTQGGIYSAS